MANAIPVVAGPHADAPCGAVTEASGAAVVIWRAGRQRACPSVTAVAVTVAIGKVRSPRAVRRVAAVVRVRVLCGATCGEGRHRFDNLRFKMKMKVLRKGRRIAKVHRMEDALSC